MSKVKVTTDWHIGAKRVGGATPASNIAMQQYLLDTLMSELDPEYPHLIAGDLLDAFTIDAMNLVQLHHTLAEFLSTGQELAVMRGNHDFNPRGSQISSFDLLMQILQKQFPKNLTVARQVTHWKQFVLVPHLANNDLLKIEVQNLSNVRDKVVVFHANYENNHAAESEHSLNVTGEMIDPLIENGCVILFGHEHDYRLARAGNVLVLGNGAPASVADCTGSGYKFSALFTNLEWELFPHIAVDDVFARIDWRHLSECPDKLFIRVHGSASAEEATQVVDALAALRQRSSAFAISNAVQIEGLADFSELTELSMEKLTHFDVLAALLEELNEREGVVVKELLGIKP